MTAAEIMTELEPLGSEGYRKVMYNHGAVDPIFGVKVEELKKIQKRVKKDYKLSLELFETGNYDAQYLAGLIADDRKMSKAEINRWLEASNSIAISGTTVAWAASESNHGFELGMEWIESDTEVVAHAGWATLSGLVAIKADSELDMAVLRNLLHRIGTSIHQQPNRVRGGMNNFVIAVGTYVPALTELALETAAKMGAVSVDRGNTACKVPSAAEHIDKVRKRGTLGKKRATVKC